MSAEKQPIETPKQRLEAIQAQIDRVKKQRIRRKDLLKLIECLVLYLKLEAKGGKR